MKYTHQSFALGLQENMADRHLVIQADYPGGPGYFGHAMDNVFPRVLTILPGAKLAGHAVSAVIPQEAREFFSNLALAKKISSQGWRTFHDLRIYVERGLCQENVTIVTKLECCLPKLSI